MYLLRIFLVLISLFSLPTNTFAEPIKSTTEVRRLTDHVMEKISGGDIEAGFALLRPTLVVPPEEVNAVIDRLKSKYPQITKRFGKDIGSEFIREDKFGENLLRIVQLQRFEKHVMRWSFYFYRGKEGWVLNTFKTDDDVKLMFPN